MPCAASPCMHACMCMQWARSLLCSCWYWGVHREGVVCTLNLRSCTPLPHIPRWHHRSFFKGDGFSHGRGSLLTGMVSWGTTTQPHRRDGNRLATHHFTSSITNHII